LLEMTGGDPLRAQDMEDRLTERWWLRYQAWVEAHPRKTKR